MNEYELRYYRHPKFERDFVQILQPQNEYKWEWQEEVVEKGPEFMRTRLELSERKKRELEAWQKVQLEESYRDQLRGLRYAHDIFLSYSSVDQKEAEEITCKVEETGGNIFMAPKLVSPGDDFAEEIRSALEGSQELWLLVSPNSIKSEWVISEWGAAWALRKRIVPILYRCSPDALPPRLKKFQCIDFHNVPEFINKKFDRKVS